MHEDARRPVWMRLGAVVYLDECEYLACQNDAQKASQKLREAVLRGDYELTGESYCPDEVALDTELMNYLSHSGEISFDV